MGIGVRGTSTSLAFIALITLSACSGYPLDAIPIPTNKPVDEVQLAPNSELELPIPGQKFAPRTEQIAEPDKAIAAVDWKKAEPVRIMLLEYTFAPHEMVLNEGTAYRLVLSNIGDKDHTFKAPSFLRAIAVRSLITVPIEEGGLAKYERDDAGPSEPHRGLLRLEVEEIPPPPPFGEEGEAGNGAAPANPFDSGDEEDDEAPANTNPFDSGDEEDIGDEDEDEDASRSQVPGKRYALGRQKSSDTRARRRLATRPGRISEVTSVTAQDKKTSADRAPQIEGEFEDDLPAQPETSNAAAPRPQTGARSQQKKRQAGPLLAQQLVGEESEIEDDDFVYRPGTNTPIQQPGATREEDAERDTDGEPASPVNAQEGGEDPADVTGDDEEDVAEEPSDDSDATDTATPEPSKKPAAQEPASQDTATQETPEPEVDENTDEASASDVDTAKPLPPLPKPRVAKIEQADETEAEDSGEDDSRRDQSETAEDADDTEDADLADLEDDAEKEDEESGELADDAAGPGNTTPTNAASDAADDIDDKKAETTDAPTTDFELIDPATLASLLKKGVIEVPARRSKLIHFVAVRKGRYHVSTLSFIDNAHWMRGTIIIE